MCLSFVGNWFVNIAVFGYIADCLRNHTAEAFVCINLAGLYLFGELESISVDTDPVFSCEFCHSRLVPFRRAAQDLFDNGSNSTRRLGANDSGLCVWKGDQKLDGP